MSSGDYVIDSAKFVGRLIEAYGTPKASIISQKLDISYQAVSNYLTKGRIPNAETLVKISSQTSCSIDWLLTGRGKKFIQPDASQDTIIATGQIETIAGRILVEVKIDETGKQPVHLETVKLQSSDIMSEKVLESSNALTGRNP